MKSAPTSIDHDLIERCIKGDHDAWESLVSRYQRLVYSVAHALCPTREDASDVFQQTWLELYQHLHELRHVAALPAWLMTVTRRRSYATIRSLRGSEQLPEEVPDQSDLINNIEDEHMLERALSQMPDRCRKLINLLYFDPKEPSYQEVAEAMDMPEASIGPTRARCLEKLRRLIA